MSPETQRLALALSDVSKGHRGDVVVEAMMINILYIGCASAGFNVTVEEAKAQFMASLANIPAEYFLFDPSKVSAND